MPERSMLAYYAPMVLAVVSLIAYQIALKSMRPGIAPLPFLVWAYLLAALFSLLLAWRFPDPTPWTIQPVDVAFAVFVALTLVGIEMGYILAYRAGWNIGIAPAVNIVAVGIVLTLVGFFAFREKIDWQGVLGLIICMVGVWILVRPRGLP